MSDASEPVIEAPVATEVAEPIVDTPIESIATDPVGEPDVEAPIVEPPAEAEDPFAAYGGKEEIEAAIRMRQAANTEDGVIQLFLEAGRSLGLGLKDMEALFTSMQGEPEEEPDPDEPLTIGQWQEFQRKQQEAEAARQAQQVQAAATAAVRSTVESLGLDPTDPSTKIILQIADTHVNGDFSPENVAKAIRQGHADYQAQVQKDAEAYLQKKREQAQQVPSAPTGSSAPAETPPAEPQNVAEAIKQARKKLGLTR